MIDIIKLKFLVHVLDLSWNWNKGVKGTLCVCAIWWMFWMVDGYFVYNVWHSSLVKEKNKHMDSNDYYLFKCISDNGACNI